MVVNGSFAVTNSSCVLTEVAIKDGEIAARCGAVQIEKALAGEMKTALAFSAYARVQSVAEEVKAKGIEGAASAIQQLGAASCLLFFSGKPSGIDRQAAICKQLPERITLFLADCASEAERT